MERSDYFVERTGYFVERSDYWLERSDLERSDHGTKWPDTFFCTFLCRCFARLQLPNYTFTRFMEENMLYVFLFALFSLLLIFTLKAASISHFLSATTKFSCCSSNKICLLCFFLFLALALCHSFSRWASLAFRLLSLFLCLCLSLYSKFMDVTINRSLIL